MGTNTTIKKTASSLMAIILLASIFVFASVSDVKAATSNPAAPKIAKGTVNTSFATLTWNKAKGAKKYQIATVSYKWKKYKQVAKTNANKKRFTKTGKYKVAVSGNKYQVYQVSKTLYNKKSYTTKNTYKWNNLKSNTTYTLAVRSINGKNTSKWVVKVITTKKKTPTFSGVPNTIKIKKGETKSITGITANSNGAISYSSTARGISVSGNKIKGISNGTYSVTVRVAETKVYQAKTINITVKVYTPSKIEPTFSGLPSSINIKKGETKAIAGFTVNSNGSISYSTSSNGISISGNKITGVSPGTYTVVVRVSETDEYYAKSVNITVKVSSPTDNNFTVNPAHTSVDLRYETVVNITATSTSGVEWSSSNTAIAEISDSSSNNLGIVICKKEGTVTINAKSKYSGEIKPITIIITNTTPSTTFEVVESTYLDVIWNNNTRIYIGQQFNDVKSTLRNNCNGYWSFTRQKYAGKSSNPLDLTVHCYNINTYSDFLAVYVADGQIIGWLSNSEILGVDDGLVYRRDNAYSNTQTSHISFIVQKNKAALIKFASSDNSGGENILYNIVNEKIMFMHVTNALRYIRGSNPVQRNTYLEGCNLESQSPYTWSGTIPWGEGEGRVLTNQRFGAQAHAETMHASGKIGHNPGKFATSGPLAIGISDIRPFFYMGSGLSQKLTGKAVEVADDIVLMGQRDGEAAVAQFANSEKTHLGSLLDNSHTILGVGIKDKFYSVYLGGPPQYDSAYEDFYPSN